LSKRIHALRNALVLFIAVFASVFASLSIINFFGYRSFTPYVAAVVGCVSGIVGGVIAWRQSRESGSSIYKIDDSSKT
jgi:protein-S-isoprenylcysteine O-methyltransferase Ste14